VYLAYIVAPVARIRAAASAWVLCVLAVVAVGCKRRVDIDGERLKTELERRADDVLERPEVDKAFDALVEAVTAEPAVAKSGEALLGQLGADDGLQPGFQAIIQTVGEHPTVTKLMKRLARENPRAGPDQLSALFEKRFNDVVDSPAFDKAFDKGFEGVLERSDVTGAIQMFERAAAANPELNRAVDDVVKSRMNDAAWNQRIVALNGGAHPDRQRATQLLLDKAFSNERMARFYVDVVSLPVIRAKTAAACSRLLQAPAFQRHLSHSLRKMVGDPGFQQGAVAAMAGMLDSRGDAESLAAPIRGLLDKPIVGRELAALLKAVNKDPVLAPIGNEVITGIVADAGFKATLAKLIDGW
jgi:hypothetical protein